MKYSYHIVGALVLGMVCLVGGEQIQAQRVSAVDKQLLQKQEDSLKNYSRQMVMAEEAPERFRADSNFVRLLVRSLKAKNSFFYSFDSLNISKLYAPDSSFRIFTWQLKKDEYVLFQKGAIQMRTMDGSLKLFPLFDVSGYSRKPMDSARSNKNWIGAIYYRVIQKEYKGKKYYTLLGFDDFTVNTNRKWLEVLHFNEQQEPVFGGPFISFKEDSANKKPVQARFNIEYKKEAKAFLNYDPEMDMIIVDHLISETDEPAKKFTYIPDGDYEAFKWKDGQWVHVNKLFSQMQQDGDYSREQMILDDAGNADEKKLEEASRKNQGGDPKKKPSSTVKPKKNQ